MKLLSTFQRAAVFTLAGLAATLVAQEAAPPAGLKIATAGHSFHVWMPGILTEIAKTTKLAGHEQLVLSSIGGSQTIQHWNVADDKNKLKPLLAEGKADVLTLAPVYLPDAGIENFVKLGLEHNPKLRITVQEFWLPFDEKALWFKREKSGQVNHDAKTIAQLREEHAPYFKEMDEHVRMLNTKYGQTAVFVVPSGQAVLELREKVLKGEVTGLTKQSDLFTDAIGHPKEHIRVLAAFCHYAVIYRRSPVGLPIPSSIAKAPEAAKLNLLLQEIAWKAVTEHPLSGVKLTR